MRSALLRLAYANIIIALNGLGFGVMACLLVGARPTASVILPAFTNIFAAYTFDKCARLDPQDEVNDAERTAFIKRFRWPLVVAATVGLAVGAVLSWRAGALGLALYFSPFIGAILYTSPVVPTGKGLRKIKEITGLKSAWVALCWGLGSGWLPVLLAGGSSTTGVEIVIAWTTVRMFVNTVFFDMGDIVGDRIEGVATIPVRFGFRTTRRLLHGINVAAGAGLALIASLGLVPPIAYVMVGLTAYAGLYLARAIDESTDLGFVCDVVADAEGFVGAVAALVFVSTLA